MALEDLTGSSKFISSLVTGNPVSNDDRREGDDHIRGVKNVLRNTFPNIDGAITLTPTQLNDLYSGGNPTALQKAANLGDVASAFTSRQNLGIHNANGAWQLPLPSASDRHAIIGAVRMGSYTWGNAADSESITFHAWDATAAFPSSGAALVLRGKAVGYNDWGIEWFVGGSESMRLDGSGRLTKGAALASGDSFTVTGRSDSYALKAIGAKTAVFCNASSLDYLVIDEESSGPWTRLLLNNGRGFLVVSGSSGKYLAGADGTNEWRLSANPADACVSTELVTAKWALQHSLGGPGGWWDAPSTAMGSSGQNTDKRPQFVSATFQLDASSEVRLEVSQDGSSWGLVGRIVHGANDTGVRTLSAPVPVATYYRARLVSGTASGLAWARLRDGTS